VDQHNSLCGIGTSASRAARSAWPLRKFFFLRKLMEARWFQGIARAGCTRAGMPLASATSGKNERD
jgi:hypothetical protein